METDTPTTVQFPTEDDGGDCPEACEEDDEDDTTTFTITLANGHAEAGSTEAMKGSPTGMVGDASLKAMWDKCNKEASESEEDEDEDEPVEGMDEKWKLDDGATINCECIMCAHETVGYEAADAMKTHIQYEHNLSFSRLKTTFGLDYPGFVQFVRWAREMKRLGKVEESIQNMWTVAPSQVPWLSDKYLLPPTEGVGEEVDYFLTLDYFAADETSPDGQPPRNSSSVEELAAQVQQLKLDKQRMTEVFQRILTEGKSQSMGSCCTKANNRYKRPRGRAEKDDESDRLRRIRLSDAISRGSVGAVTSKTDLYFDSYNEIGIHHEMIFDRARTEAYRMAIIERSPDMKGKLVMDIGCGTGILSMFCAQQDPKLVYAVDKSHIIFDAMSNGFENNFDSKIQFLHKDIDSDDMKDLEGKINVLVSEFMGYFLFFEGMTETYIRARDKFLAPDGIVLPDACTVELAPIGPSGLYKTKVACWDDAFGFRMPALQTRVLNEVLVEYVSPSEIIGSSVQVKHLNLRTCNLDSLRIDAKFEFEFNQDTEFCGVAGFFLVNFEGINNKITLSTSPLDPPTHWKQAVFFWPKHFPVKAGEKLEGFIFSYPHPENPRWLVVNLCFDDLIQKYEFR